MSSISNAKSNSSSQQQQQQPQKSQYLVNTAKNILPPPPPSPPSQQKNNKNEFSTPSTIKTSTSVDKTNKTDRRDLKSSMKRLFSPNHHSSSSSSTSIPKTPSKSTSMRSTIGQQQQQFTLKNLNDAILLNSANKSLENLSTISTTSSNTSSIATTSTTSTNNTSSRTNNNNSNRMKTTTKTTINSTNSKNIELSTAKKIHTSKSTTAQQSMEAAAAATVSESPRNLTTSSLKKHLNLFRNTKKVLIGSTAPPPSSTNNDQLLPPPPPLPPSPTGLFNLPPAPPSPPTYQQQQVQYDLNEQKFIKEVEVDYKKKQLIDTNAQVVKMNELNYEIERLSRLYDLEVSKQNKYEEKIQLFKQIAEEKQIESAALKYEYRKMQELKDNLIAENSYLKSFILQPSNTSSNTSPALKSSTMLNSPRLNNNNNSNSNINLTPSSTSSLTSNVNLNRNSTTQQPQQSPRNNNQFNNIQGKISFLLPTFTFNSSKMMTMIVISIFLSNPRDAYSMNATIILFCMQLIFQVICLLELRSCLVCTIQ